MANVYFVGQGAGPFSFTDATIWTPNVPTTGDHVWIDNGNGVINSNMDQSAVTIASFRVGPGFTGKIGDSGSPWKLGPVTTGGWINAPYAQAIFIQPKDAGDALPVLYVTDCGSSDDALHIPDGTITAMYILKGGRIRIGDSAIVATVHIAHDSNIRSDANVTIESGATITTIDQFGGKLNNSATVTTVNCYDGELVHEGITTMDITTLNMLGNNAIFRFQSRGGTITTVNGKAGLFDGANGSRKRIVTTMNAFPGFTADLRTGINSIAITNALNREGGVVLGDPGRDYTLAAIPAA